MPNIISRDGETWYVEMSRELWDIARETLSTARPSLADKIKRAVSGHYGDVVVLLSPSEAYRVRAIVAS